MRGNEYHQAARANLVNAVGKEIIMHLIAINLFLPKRNVGNNQIKIVIRCLAVLEPLILNEGARIEHFGKSGSKIIQLNAAQIRFCHHITRHTAVEIANTHRWIQNTAMLKAQTRNAFPYRPDDARAGIKGVVHGRLSSIILIICE